MAHESEHSGDPPSAGQLAILGEELGRVALASAGSMTAPLFWSRNDPLQGQRLQNGSLFFLDAGLGVFGVTAAHVVRSCLDDARNTSFRHHCMIARHEQSPYPIDLTGRIMAIHDGMDIATLRFSQAEVNEIGITIVRSDPDSWPPPLACLDSIVTYAGWPGVGRAWLGPNDLKFGLVVMDGQVTSAHDTCISIQIEREKLKQVFGDKEMPPDFDFGGLSGGPALRLLEGPTFPSWALEGVVFGGPNPSGDPAQSIAGFELISIRPANFLNSNGTLDLHRWHSNRPW